LAKESLRVDLGRMLHDRLIAGDPTARALIASEMLPAVYERLSGYRIAYRVDDQIVQDAVTDAFFEYADYPEAFDPDRSSLEAYLRMAAYRNLQNSKEKVETQKKNETAVELDPSNRNVSWEEEFIANDERTFILSQIPGKTLEEKLAHILPDKPDQVICLLMLGGERDSAFFAEVLGLSGDTETVRRDVKRHKDRVTKVLQRFGKRLSHDDPER